MFTDPLSQRDQDIIDAVQTFKQLTSNQVQRLFFADGAEPSRTGKTNRALRRLVRWGYLKRIEERAIGGWATGSHGYVYIPPKGEPQVRDPHTLNIAQFYIELRECPAFEVIEYRNEKLNPEWNIISDADMRLRFPQGIFRAVVEVEHSAKSDERMRQKLAAYVRAAATRDRFPLVLLLALNDKRLRAIQRAIDDSDEPAIFRAVLFSDGVSSLLP